MTTTAHQGRRESEMDSAITPAMRFAMHDLERSLPYGGLRRAVRQATYWESFPGSYTPEMVEASKALHRAVWDNRNPDAWCGLAERIVALDDDATERRNNWKAVK